MNMTLGQEHSRSALPRSTIYGGALFISFRNMAWTLYTSIPGQAIPVVFRQKSLAITQNLRDLLHDFLVRDRVKMPDRELTCIMSMPYS